MTVVQSVWKTVVISP